MTKFNDLVSLVHKTKNKDMLENLLLGLTTAHERKVLAKRVDVVRRLIRGEAQHSIAEELGVGVSTVARGARELERGYFKVLHRK